MIKQSLIILICSIFLFGSANSLADSPDSEPYEFNWKGAKDMSGAFMMCAFTAYTQGDCPQVLLKCFTDFDLIKIKLFSLEYKCLNLFAFFSSGEDVAESLAHAESEEGVEPDVSNETDVIEGVVASNEQISDPEGQAEAYEANTPFYHVYQVAEENTYELVDDDYNDYYYFGDGNGNGGWGTVDYQKDEFINTIYTGLTEIDAYNDAYNVAYNTQYDITYIDVYDSEYENLLNEAEYTLDPLTGEKQYTDSVLNNIDYQADANAQTEAINQANISGVDSGTAAALVQESIIDDEYSVWRSEQEWSTLGYGKEDFQDNYNEERFDTYYNTFVEASATCNLGCAKEAALNSVDGLPTYII